MSLPVFSLYFPICYVVCLSVRGIRDQSKMRSIFSYLREQKSKHIFCNKHIQNDENIWKKQRGGKLFSFHGTK